jgi:prepilin-type N-terminal cleavage/methylation domain-containing protein
MSTTPLNLTNSRRGLTLVEVLIVAAIVAILAAIAIPNFLTASTRAKVSRTANDLRVLSGALEAYFVDHRAYPLCNPWGVAAARPSVPNDVHVLERLSTPVAYVTTALLPSPFVAKRFSGSVLVGLGPIETDTQNWRPTGRGGADEFLYNTYGYHAVAPDDDALSGLGRAQHDVFAPDRKVAIGFIIQSPGPQEAVFSMGGIITNADAEYAANLKYDPTNGTVSFGNIFRTGGTAEAGNNFFTTFPTGTGG